MPTLSFPKRETAAQSTPSATAGAEADAPNWLRLDAAVGVVIAGLARPTS